MTLELMVKHMGRHISTDRTRHAFEEISGRKLAMTKMMNGVKVARMYTHP